MNRINGKIAGGGVSILLLLLLIGGVVDKVVDPSTAEASDPGTSTGGANSSIVMVSQSCENPAAAVKDLLLRQGFKPGQFVIGEDQFNLDLPEATEEGTGNFGASATTAEGMVSFLESDTKAAREVLRHSMREAAVTRAEALDPKNWVGFQLLVKSKWEGNTAFEDGTTKSVGTRSNAQGDLGWVLINPDDCRKVERSMRKSGQQSDGKIRTAFVRGGCVNPQTEPPTPDNPPNNPPDDNPPDNPCPPGTVTYDGRCIKPEGQNDSDGAGGDESPTKQPVKENPQGPTHGAPESEPPKPNHNGSEEENGSPGYGDAEPEGPEDNSHEDDDTTVDDSPECPFGPGNC